MGNYRKAVWKKAYQAVRRVNRGYSLWRVTDALWSLRRELDVSDDDFVYLLIDFESALISAEEAIKSRAFNEVAK